MLFELFKTIGGPLISGAFSAQNSKDNYDAQKEFAQNGIQWRVADATAAGLHPLAALQGGGTSFSPSFNTGSGMDFGKMFDDMAGMGKHGQNTDRAQRAVLSDYDREKQALHIRSLQLQNSLLESQLAQNWSHVMGQPSNPPAPGPSSAVPAQSSGQTLALPGAVKPGVVKLEPSKSESARPGDAGVAAGRSPLFREQVISNKSSANLLTPEAGELFEAYGEVLKPFMAAGAHGLRWWDNELQPRLARGWENDKARGRAFLDRLGRAAARSNAARNINPRERR